LKKIFILFFLIFTTTLSSFAFEDCLIFTNGKMTDISIEHNDIINVHPLITIMNNKNTLIVHPLKIGKTRFCILKNEKEKVVFHVMVTDTETIINDVDGFEIQTLDAPPTNDEFKIDAPPKLKERRDEWNS